MNLENELQQSTRFTRLVHVPSCNSTQALSVEDSHDDQAVFWADHQTHGRGRQGRSWHDSPADDVAVTFRLRGVHLAEPARIGAVIPVAAARALAELLPEIAIKWPNDLLLHGRKICGILIDSEGQPPDTHHIGVGINTNRTSFPDELRERSTSIALATGREIERERVVLALARTVDEVVSLLEVGDVDTIAAEFRSRLGLLDRPVRVRTGNQTIEGTLTDLDLDHLEIDGGRYVFPMAHVQEVR